MFRYEGGREERRVEGDYEGSELMKAGGRIKGEKNNGDIGVGEDER